MNESLYNKLLEFLQELEQRKISYSLEHNRYNAVMVLISVPGERWEVEFLDDGSVEVERYKSDGKIYGEDVLNELFSKHSD